MQSEALKKIYQLDEFLALKPDFEKDLTTSIEIIINGLQAHKPTDNNPSIS